MASRVSKLASIPFARLLSHGLTPLPSRALCTAMETQTQKLERIAGELLDLTKLERRDFGILFRRKMGLGQYGPAGSDLDPSGSSGPAPAETPKAAEKTVFDLKLEKFDAAAKIKIIKEIRGFTSLGLKEAKDLVEKAPVVVKNGLSKEEGNAIVDKLKELGATAVLE